MVVSEKFLWTDDDGYILKTLHMVLTPMTISAVRAFRHTATVIALTLGTALCGIASGYERQYASANRSVQGDKRKNSNASLMRVLKDLENKKNELEQHLTTLFDAIFIHRCRDMSDVIRMECITEFGAWVKSNPEMFLNQDSLKYLGWSLSDKARNPH